MATSTTRPLAEILKAPFPSYHKPLEMARTWSRSGVEEDRRDAIELLKGLIARYPHALVFGQELVLALIEGGGNDEAEATLRRFERDAPGLDEEFLCRWGRLFKDSGDRQARGSPPEITLAEEFYRKALEKYDRAYQIRSGHYPGINKATLLLVLAALAPTPPGSPPSPDLQASADLASEILANRPRWNRDDPDDEPIWHAATAGEAHLLRQEWNEAASQYREVLRRQNLKPHARESIRKQIERVVASFSALGVVVPPPFDRPAAFFVSNLSQTP